MKQNHLSSLAFLLISIIALSGCGPKRNIEVHMVTGKVTLDDAPIKGVYIQFIPVEGATGELAAGYSNEDGSFKLSSSNGDPDTGAMLGDTFSKVYRAPDAPPGSRPKETLLPNYADAKKSPFRATIVKGKNSFEFALKSRL